jgi:hypothetical protein
VRGRKKIELGAGVAGKYPAPMPPPLRPAHKVRTPAEEILLSVQQWYFSRGMKVPPEEEASCKKDIVREKQETDYVAAFLTKAHAEDELSIVKHENPDDVYTKSAEYMKIIAAAKKQIEATPKELRTLETPSTDKPAYGSKEFWKAHWEKKKAAGLLQASKAKT